MFILYTLIALAAGVALASQAAINSQLAKAMGDEPLIATFISFGTGALLLLVISAIKTDLLTQLATVTQHSWWKFIGGSLGVLVVFTTILLSPKMGITNMLFFIIVGQLITAMIIDHYGLINMPVREVNIFKLIGLAIVGIGLVTFFFGDKLMKLFH
ncbi:MAG: DMT family transporter [Pasteurella oralis]|uniref:DMT family transporter n=1 Tax=Pasteurella oralis TaxID=1071947 RepID=UPI000C7DBCED|nr:DMT family transporter [Pasteurella oralis]MDO5054616.1 DMT family transporter [Pasteurella oralis]